MPSTPTKIATTKIVKFKAHTPLTLLFDKKGFFTRNVFKNI